MFRLYHRGWGQCKRVIMENSWALSSQNFVQLNTTRTELAQHYHERGKFLHGVRH
jgi:hypothetical protein